jgi:hypothetical protein
LDGSDNVPLDSNLVFTFNEPVIKGQGNIYVVRQGTGTTGVAVDVNSPNVTINGAVVTVDLPIDLQLDNSYFVHIDSGSFIDLSSTPTTNATLLTQSFDYLPLGPKVFEASGTGSDWTPTPPIGFESRLDNPNMEGVGAAEWRGWTFARKDFWIAADNQSRDQFLLGDGTVAIGDTDEYDDGPGAVRPFQSTLITKAVNLNGVAENSVRAGVLADGETARRRCRFPRCRAPLTRAPPLRASAHRRPAEEGIVGGRGVIHAEWSSLL